MQWLNLSFKKESVFQEDQEGEGRLKNVNSKLRNFAKSHGFNEKHKNQHKREHSKYKK